MLKPWALPFLTSAHASACANYLPAYLSAHESFHCLPASTSLEPLYKQHTHEFSYLQSRVHPHYSRALPLLPTRTPLHCARGCLHYSQTPPVPADTPDPHELHMSTSTLTYTSTTCTHEHFHCFTREISPLASSCSYFQLYESTSTTHERHYILRTSTSA